MPLASPHPPRPRSLPRSGGAGMLRAMPLPDRTYTPYVGSGPIGDLRRRALEVLTSPGLAYLVDLVAWKQDELVHVAAHRGHATLSRTNERVVLDGVDPVADQDWYCADGYPFAAERLHSLFDE